MFGKLEATMGINTSGIGLGQCICKKIVEVFDGRIFLDEDYPGPGSKFSFTVKALAN